MGDPYELYPVSKIGASWQQWHKHNLFGVERQQGTTPFSLLRQNRADPGFHSQPTVLVAKPFDSGL